MKTVISGLGILAVALIILFYFSIKERDHLRSKLQLSEDSIALYKKHEELLLNKITISEEREQAIQKGVAKILDSLKTISHEKQILWVQLHSIKPQHYTPNELNELWAARYR